MFGEIKSIKMGDEGLPIIEMEVSVSGIPEPKPEESEEEYYM